MRRYGIRVDKGMVSLAEWLRDFKAAKGTYYYNEKDMAPFEHLFEHWDHCFTGLRENAGNSA